MCPKIWFLLCTVADLFSSTSVLDLGPYAEIDLIIPSLISNSEFDCNQLRAQSRFFLEYALRGMNSTFGILNAQNLYRILCYFHFRPSYLNAVFLQTYKHFLYVWRCHLQRHTRTTLGACEQTTEWSKSRTQYGFIRHLKNRRWNLPTLWETGESIILA